jgi:hypothetical protein
LTQMKILQLELLSMVWHEIAPYLELRPFEDVLHSEDEIS